MNGRGSYSNGWWALSIGVQGEAKQMGSGHMGCLSSVGCEVRPNEWPGIIFKWVVAALGWLSSFRVRGEAKRMGQDRIQMGGGHLGWLSSIGVRGEAKRMGGGCSRQGLVAVLATWALWGGCRVLGCEVRSNERAGL